MVILNLDLHSNYYQTTIVFWTRWQCVVLRCTGLGAVRRQPVPTHHISLLLAGTVELSELKVWMAEQMAGEWPQLEAEVSTWWGGDISMSRIRGQPTMRVCVCGHNTERERASSGTPAEKGQGVPVFALAPSPGARQPSLPCRFFLLTLLLP